MKIAKDIVIEIESKSLGEKKTQELLQLCEEIYEQKLNVGHDQLVRSMLVLSKFDREKFLAIIDANFYGDPRDVLVSAQAKYESLNSGINIFPLDE